MPKKRKTHAKKSYIKGDEWIVKMDTNAIWSDSEESKEWLQTQIKIIENGNTGETK